MSDQTDLPDRVRTDDAEPEPGLPMSSDRMDWCLQMIGWARNECARRLMIPDGTVRQMLRGRRNIPNDLAAWLEELAALHRARPHPANWRNAAREAEDA